MNMILDNKTAINETKVWIENGMIIVKTGEDCGLEKVEKLTRDVVKTAKTLKTKANVLVDASTALPAYNVFWRKRVMNIFKDTLIDPGFRKIAIWGPKMSSIKIVSMFLLGALGFGNIKYFDEKEKALEWLKKD